MSTLVELTAQIVASHASGASITSEELLKNIQQVHATLKALETGDVLPAETSSSSDLPKMTIKQAFKKDEVICYICNKGFKTLKRHLAVAHDMKPGQYRKEFGIPTSQSLAAKNYVESRRQMAIDKGLGDGLAKARAAKKADSQKENIPFPVIKTNVAVTKSKKKAEVPVKLEITKPVVNTEKTPNVKTASKAWK